MSALSANFERRAYNGRGGESPYLGNHLNSGYRHNRYNP